jgi:transaldolase
MFLKHLAGSGDFLQSALSPHSRKAPKAVALASIRCLEHLLYCFALETELVTVPAKILELWASKNFPMPDKRFQYKSPGKPIPYEELDLEGPWETLDIQHELTRKGIEKFAADYRATLSRPA